MILDKNTPAIVTGGASGLGAAVVRNFLDMGLPVGILDIAEPEGDGAEFALCDVTDVNSIQDALSVLREKIGQERICVNCAGIAPAAKTISRGVSHDPGLFSRVVQINLVGTFNVASQSALGMSAAEPLDADGARGVIINTASIAAYEGQMGQAAYAASKAGVVGLTLPMARDLAVSGVRVLAIAPGIFATPMVKAFPKEVQNALGMTSEFPKRLGHVEEFANLVAHMAGNSMLNGAVIRLDAATRMQAK